MKLTRIKFEPILLSILRIEIIIHNGLKRKIGEKTVLKQSLMRNKSKN
jgi:hypothetical protein